MWGIALRMLFRDRARSMALVVGLAFATTLIVQQASILTGILGRTGANILAVPQPDVWVMYPGTQYFDERKPLEDSALLRVRGVPGVDWAVPLYVGSASARLPDGSFATVQVFGVDRASKVGLPGDLAGAAPARLEEPDVVFWDHLNIPLYTKVRAGDILEINDHRAVVAGLALGPRAFTASPIVYTTYERALQYSPGERRRMSYVLAKARKGTSPDDLAMAIRARTGLQALTSEGFFWSTVKVNMKRIPAAVNFAVTILLGVVVGVAVSGQSFFTFVLENTRYFGMLKALGTSNRTLRRMVLLQATVVGATGWGLGVGAASLFGMNVGPRSQIAFVLTPHLLAASALLVLAMVWAAAAVSIRRILRIEPAMVFRG
jgi:putative ABC transport system permease protein